MKREKEVRISYLAAHLTTIVSVTLVLMLMGIIALVWISADRETRRLRERIEISVIMADSVPDARAQDIANAIKAKNYASKVSLVTKVQALKNWTADTGEDLEAMFGVNPLSPEVNFTLKSEYAGAGNIETIRKTILKVPGVEEVSSPDSAMIDSMNKNIERLTIILGIIVAVMIVISFVLINNTVHLTIYSRRFTIHTMQLVGATNGFIRRPVVVNNLLAGAVSGLLASAVLALTIFVSSESAVAGLDSYIGWESFGVVAAGLVLAGMALCSLAAVVASTRYLRKDYDRLFK
ncbi:MAG: permease-like cell division protein FtsX [Candidatus Amulumruptor caecigallinarius]|nr:permease-like cell division protein FtsX [Candidatus Amulumruptor caecigallinarius]